MKQSREAVADGPIRDSERTKRAILEAAQKCLIEQGGGVALAHVANEAGISKSGLLHHYPNREALLLAVAQDTITQFRDEVVRFLDLSENYPGKMLRAYVRALCGGSEVVMTAFSPTTVWNMFIHVPGADQLSIEDNAQWERELAADGLSANTILVVKYAAEGIASAAPYDPLVTPELLAHTRDLLCDLTLPGRASLEDHDEPHHGIE